MADDSEIERIAKVVEAYKRRLTRTEFTLHWSTLFPYVEKAVELMAESEIGSSVYELWEQRDARRVAVYVGETKDLGRRLAEHISRDEPNERIRQADRSRMYFSYAEITGHIARKCVERALWKLYQYEWNSDEGPAAMGVEQTLLLNEVFPAPYTINFNGVRRPLQGVTSPVELP